MNDKMLLLMLMLIKESKQAITSDEGILATQKKSAWVVVRVMKGNQFISKEKKMRINNVKGVLSILLVTASAALVAPTIAIRTDMMLTNLWPHSIFPRSTFSRNYAQQLFAFDSSIFLLHDVIHSFIE